MEAHRLSRRCDDYAKKTVSFLKDTTGSSAVVFTWHDSADAQPPHVQIGADELMISEYYEKYAQKDPLRLDLLVKNYRSFETFSHAAETHDRDLMEQYQPFLRKYSLVDEIDFVFWAGGKAVASAALLQKNTKDLKISPDNLREMQRYLQYTFSFIPAIKALDLREQLISRYRLTAKEQVVAALIISGESNKSIAEMTDVELATVKTHVLHIFQKLEVNSRSKAIALLSAA